MPILGNASWVVTLDSSDTVIKDGSVLVQDNTIMDIGKTDELKQKHPSEEFIDLKRHILIPGLVNAHMHSDQILFRGLGADSVVMDWIRKAKVPTLRNATLDELTAGLELGFLESVKTGATTNVDNQDARTENKITERSIDFAGRLGFRVCVARPFRPIEDMHKRPGMPVQGNTIKEEFVEHERLIKQHQDPKDRMKKIYVGMFLASQLSDEGLLKPFELAEKYDLKLHFHMAENKDLQEKTQQVKGCRGIEYLDKMGVLGDRIQLAHGIWFSDNELKLLINKGGHVLHCASSNAYLSSGICNVPKYLGMGINVALGTDGAGSNDTHDMMATVRLSTQLAKISHPNEQVITAKDVLKQATIGGARAQNMDDIIGTIEVGKRADIVGLGLDKTRAIPVFNPYAAAVYQLDGSDVRFVMINGKTIIQDYGFKTVNEQEIMNKAEEAALNIRRKVIESNKNR
ncbi:MAG: amidohydrolase family protein [Candidatus Ranarchaeia archaeon]